MLRYVLFKSDPSTKDEIYLARNEANGFTSVSDPDETNITFDTAGEGYVFAKHFPKLANWRVGYR
jgi:hypothetical protein